MKQNKREHLSLLYDISELSALVSESKDIDTFMQQVVQSVASHLHADVGSIYLLDDNSGELVLKATQGLNPTSVDHIRMRVGEGLVGVTMARMEPLCDGAACNNPNFKFFEEAHEEPYASFLSVPIHRGIEKIGVLVVQHRQSDYFDDADVLALRAIAAQLAGIVANVKLMIGLRKPSKATKPLTFPGELRFIKGKASAAGFAQAPAIALQYGDPLMADAPDSTFQGSVKAYQRSLRATIDQLKQLQEQVVKRLPESAALIFEAHYMILKDPRFDRQIVELIRQGLHAAEAVRSVARQFITLFGKSANPYIREKSQDIEDLARRILFNLRKEKGEGRSPMDGHIVIASQLYPSDVLKLASENVAGIILVNGGTTSHVAIMARSLQIPMIICQRGELLQLPADTLILMDADLGNIYIDPSDHVRRQFTERNRVQQETAGEVVRMQPQTFSKDGTRVHLLANINLLSELSLARDLKAEGVGLYRSEFPFIVRSVLPSEEEQRLVYERLFQQMADRPVCVRTLDIGGEKVLPYLNLPQEANPELGLRSIRFLLKHRDVFDQQLRAILRAGARTEQLSIMFPMISSLDEFAAARTAVDEALADLAREGLDHHTQPAIGTMIEMPSVLAIIDELADAADFFAIGTNDFIQYMLAVDRANENVASYYQPFHPAILRALARIVETANRYAKPVSVCGETAHDPAFIPFLIGIGVRRLSVDPLFLPLVQRTLGQLSIEHALSYAQELVASPTLRQVELVRAKWQPIILPQV
jgi:phosphotransferase system enzyme I (PtsP)